MLSQETVQRFKQIWQRDFGVELDDKQASKLAHDTVQYFDTLAQIKSQKEADDEK